MRFSLSRSRDLPEVKAARNANREITEESLVMTEDAGISEDPSEEHPGESSPKVRIIRSAELLQGEREVCIDHEGEIYRLRLTRNKKLILHK